MRSNIHPFSIPAHSPCCHKGEGRVTPGQVHQHRRRATRRKTNSRSLFLFVFLTLSHTLTHNYGQFKVPSSPFVLVLGLREEAGENLTHTQGERTNCTQKKALIKKPLRPPIKKFLCGIQYVWVRKQAALHSDDSEIKSTVGGNAII